MLTVLKVEDLREEKWYMRLLNRVKGNKISEEIRQSSLVFVKFITYRQRYGDINWKRLDLVIGNQRNHLVCDERINLPKSMGYKRFDNREFKVRLASNMFIYILSQLENINLKVALYDPKGEYTEVLSHIIKYVACPVVVTDNLTAFNYEIKNIYEEYGATIQLTNNRSSLSQCDFIMAPFVIDELLPVSGNAIIISGFKPSVETFGMVYYNFDFRLPKQFENLFDDELNSEYVCGALYTKGKQYELGSIVPVVCSNQNSAQTRKSILNYLKKHTRDENENKTEENEP